VTREIKSLYGEVNGSLCREHSVSIPGFESEICLYNLLNGTGEKGNNVDPNAIFIRTTPRCCSIDYVEIVKSTFTPKFEVGTDLQLFGGFYDSSVPKKIDIPNGSVLMEICRK
jgi:hypothetical protein